MTRKNAHLVVSEEQLRMLVLGLSRLLASMPASEVARPEVVELSEALDAAYDSLEST